MPLTSEARITPQAYEAMFRSVRLPWRQHVLRWELALDDRPGHLSELQVAAARVAAQCLERRLHVDVAELGQHPLRLLDDHPGGQGLAQLLGLDRCPEGGTMLQDADGRHVRHGLTDLAVVLGEPRTLAEQVQCSDDLPAQAQWKGVHRLETHAERNLGEPWPALVGGEILDRHRGSGVHALDAGSALAALQLEELQHPGRLAGGGQELGLQAVVEQEQARLLHRQQLDDGVHQPVEQVHDVVVVDQGVGQRHEPLRQQRVPSARVVIHRNQPLQVGVVARPPRVRGRPTPSPRRRRWRATAPSPR